MRGLVVREAATGSEALAAIRTRRPDLVVAEAELPELSGFELCHVLQDSAQTQVQVLLVSAAPGDADLAAGLLLGSDYHAVGMVTVDELVGRAIETDPSPAEPLTQREREVLGLLAEGLGQAHIARRLVLSEKTVANHIDRLRAKLGVRTRAQAVAVAYRDRLLPGPREAGRAGPAALRSSREWPRRRSSRE